MNFEQDQNRFSSKNIFFIVGCVSVSLVVGMSRLGPLAGFGFAAVYMFVSMEWLGKKEKKEGSVTVNLIVSLGVSSVFAACYGAIATIWFKPSNDAEWMFSPLNAFLFCGAASFGTNLLLLMPCWATRVIWKAIAEDRQRQHQPLVLNKEDAAFDCTASSKTSLKRKGSNEP